MKSIHASTAALAVIFMAGCTSLPDEGDETASQEPQVTAAPELMESPMNQPGNNSKHDTACGGHRCPPGAELGEMCGGFAGIQCADDLYCDFPVGTSCGASDQAGSCAMKPELCTDIYQPVCGCDGRTYGNACSAARDGVSIRVEGKCDASADGMSKSCDS